MNNKTKQSYTQESVNETRTIVLQDGKIAIDLITPDKQQDLEIAVVELGFIERLVDFLPSVPFDVIKRKMQEKIDQVDTIEGYIQALENELSFHRTLEFFGRRADINL